MNPTRLLSAAILASAATLAHAQPAAQAPAATPAESSEPDPAEEGEDTVVEELVVTGGKPRGAVVGDIAPVIQLDSRDIRAFGANDLSELLDSLAPQIGSSRGRGGEAPVVLLNGRRVSGFREVRSLPPEAIARIDILPEEVALKYGFRADQRVVNVVLRRRFRAVTAQARGSAATAGGHADGGLELGMLRIQGDSRTSLKAEGEGASALLETERDLTGASPFRTLVAGNRPAIGRGCAEPAGVRRRGRDGERQPRSGRKPRSAWAFRGWGRRAQARARLSHGPPRADVGPGLDAGMALDG